jgi:DNA-binding NtrC family response regulator
MMFGAFASARKRGRFRMAQVAGAHMPFPDPKERKPAILVVEDEFLIRMALSDYLQECGFKVFEARDAAEAIEVLKTNNIMVDCVFTDVRMPGEMDGFGLSAWIRENYPGLLVILTSGDVQKVDSARELCESEPFFAKPYDLEYVVAQIRDLLDKRKSRE